MTVDRTYAIFSAVSEKVQKLFEPDRFYAVLYDPDRKMLSFPLISEGGTAHRGGKFPWEARSFQKDLLPDQVIDQNSSILLQLGSDGIALPPELKPLGKLTSFSWLAVPLKQGEQAIGALVIESKNPAQEFGEDRKRLFESIAQQIALALQNVSLYEDQQRKVDYLHVLNQIGQNITSIHTSEEAILKNIYEQAKELPLDTDNMYIALYYPDQDLVTFPLVYEHGRRVYAQGGEAWQPRSKHYRRTEWVIRHKESKLIRTQQQALSWYRELDQLYDSSEIFSSWMGAPMLAGDQVLGVIAIRHQDEYKYDQDDRHVVEILASQAAVAIQNFRLFRERNNAEIVAMQHEITAEFIHRMNNLAGTIPINASLLRSRLKAMGIKDDEVSETLDAIYKDAKQILSYAQRIREATKPGNKERVVVAEVIDTALDRVQTALPGADEMIKVTKNFEEGLPDIQAERNKMIDVMTNMIKNAMDAMIPNEGLLTLSTRQMTYKGVSSVEICIKDTGIGITDINLAQIFDLFFTTKPDGTGFGLWRDRQVIRALGGDILVKSKVDEGSSFFIFIPINLQQIIQEQVRGEKDGSGR